MNDFNLVVSTARDFERQAECELWFNLLALGDETPIIFRPGVPGLILAKTSIEPKQLGIFLQKMLDNRDPNYVQFIFKIYPLDTVVESSPEIIRDACLNLVKTHPLCQNPDSHYRITIRKRFTNLKTDAIISLIAEKISFAVSLQKYDWILQLEIIGDMTGIAILRDEDVFAPKKEKEHIIEHQLTDISE